MSNCLNIIYIYDAMLMYMFESEKSVTFVFKSILSNKLSGHSMVTLYFISVLQYRIVLYGERTTSELKIENVKLNAMLKK